MGRRKSGELFSREMNAWLRGTAVILVVLSHYAEWWTWFYTEEAYPELFWVAKAMMRLGVYGVGLFFLLSGYAMVKSLGGRGMSGKFVLKRLTGSYFPYLIVVGAIELCSGGFTSADDFLKYVTGWDFWFMFVLFVLYIGFVIIWCVGGMLKPVIFTLFVAAFSWFLYERGQMPFWYVSNMAFALGVLLASYEKRIDGWLSGLRIPGILLGMAGMVWVVYSWAHAVPGTELEPDQIWSRLGAVMIFVLFIVFAAMHGQPGKGILPFLGKNSLYIYLTHTFIFMRCVNSFTFAIPLRFLAAAVITVAVSWLTNTAVTWLLGLLFGRRK